MMKTILWFLIGLTLLIGTSPIQAQELDLNQQYREYLQGLPPFYYATKAREVMEKGGLGDPQLCNNYYSHYDEYVTYCKDYGSADILRLYKCMEMTATMWTTLKNPMAECKPELDKTVDGLVDEMYKIYNHASQQDTQPLYLGLIHQFMIVSRLYGDTELMADLIREETELRIRQYQGKIETDVEDAKIARKGSIDAGKPYRPSSPEYTAQNVFNRMWRYCSRRADTYPDCQRELYYILKKNGLEHLLKDQNQAEGERITEGWRPKKRKPRSDKRVRLKPKVQDEQPQRVVKKEPEPTKEPAPDKTPEDASNSTLSIWLTLLGILAGLGMVIGIVLVRRKWK